MDLHGLLHGYLYFFICRLCSYLTGNTPMGLHGLLRGYIYFFTFILDYGDVSKIFSEEHLIPYTDQFAFETTIFSLLILETFHLIRRRNRIESNSSSSSE
jgi:hypothetical protein